MVNWPALLRSLESLGAQNLSTTSHGVPVDELPTRAICSPPDVARLRDVVRIAYREHCPVYVLGGCTRLPLGRPGKAEGIGLETTQLSRVIDYPSRDMTITVEAGIRIARLQEILRAEGQRLPVDVPRAAEATLGGAVATNSSGPRRF